MAGTRNTTKKQAAASGRPATRGQATRQLTESQTHTPLPASSKSAKRKAEEDLSAASAPKSKKPKRTTRPSSSKVEINANLLLQAKFEVLGHDVYECITEIAADFFLKTNDNGSSSSSNGKEIGSIITYLVTKNLKNEETGKKEWIGELLTPSSSSSSSPEKLDEISTVFRTLYTPSSTPRAAFTPHKKSLQAPQILFIHTFALLPAYRGLGIAQTALKAFFQELRTLPDGMGYSGPIVLSPAADEEARQEMQEKGTWRGEEAAEEGLVRSWGKSEFGVWVRGEEGMGEGEWCYGDGGGGVVEMGRVDT